MDILQAIQILDEATEVASQKGCYTKKEVIMIENALNVLRQIQTEKEAE